MVTMYSAPRIGITDFPQGHCRERERQRETHMITLGGGGERLIKDIKPFLTKDYRLGKG